MTKRRMATDEERNSAQSMFESGRSLTAIGNELERSTSTIATWAKRGGWTRPEYHDGSGTEIARKAKRSQDAGRWQTEADELSDLVIDTRRRLATAIAAGDSTSATAWGRLYDRLILRAVELVGWVNTQGGGWRDPASCDPEEVERMITEIAEMLTPADEADD